MSGLLVHRLPDSYAKPVRGREAETATNTWRLFAVNEEQTEQFTDMLELLHNMLDLQQCSGDALDRLGEMYKLPRPSGLSDHAYRTELLSKIGSYFSDGTMNQVLEAVATACGTEVGALYFLETSPAMVTLHIRSMKVFRSLPVTLLQLKTIIQNLLPVGVGLEAEIWVDEQFQYCTAGEEQSPDLNGTGYNEPTAGLGSFVVWKGETT